MTNEAFIAKNKDADVRSLALNKAPEGIDLHFCLQQIEGRQIAVRKLPSFILPTCRWNNAAASRQHFTNNDW